MPLVNIATILIISDSMDGPLHESPPPDRQTARRPLAVILLVLYVLFLCGSTYFGRDLEGEKSVWDLQDTRQLLEWILGRLTSGVMELVRFLPLGFLTILSLGGNYSRGSFSR